jgi:hypothetical protein
LLAKNLLNPSFDRLNSSVGSLAYWFLSADWEGINHHNG